MAVISGTSATYVYAAQTTAQSLGGGSVSGAAKAKALPSELSSSRFTTHRTTITKTQASSMLSLAVYIATSIISIIGSLTESTKVANGSLTQPAAGIHVGYQTRLSTGNIQAGVQLTLEGIDKLVSRTAVGTANILSSTSNDISILTSVYGGKLNVAPQPFDVAGLGIQNLDLHTIKGRTDALARLGQAQLTAEKRLLNLQSLRSGLSNPGALSSALRTLGATAGNLRGTLVNISG